MLRYIYKRLFFSIVFLLFCSCKLYQSERKEALQEEQTQSKYKQQLDIWYSGQRDSQSRHWLFLTDSSFRFHPDSGLFGRNGQLAMLESNVITSESMEISTNSSNSHTQRLHEARSEKSNVWAAFNLWIIVFVLVAVLIGWKFRNFFKT
ncbi:hypothetical protein [Sphingobacterium sp. UBA5996]|uniref:hypothetical protein n=1 Tax=Sphingobacterium sp. UBA5996 TaxID=1947505 RepID=UPI0025F206E2|nr:hypothetical protein [Sphingobacterium sp. UBA5996]